jgi:hypothetical protein
MPVGVWGDEWSQRDACARALVRLTDGSGSWDMLNEREKKSGTYWRLRSLASCDVTGGAAEACADMTGVGVGVGVSTALKPGLSAKKRR